MKKVITLITLIIFVFTSISVDFLALKSLRVPLSIKIQTSEASVTPSCPPAETDSSKVGTYSATIGQCVLNPSDTGGKCLPPYIYSSQHKTCVTVPICPPTFFWNPTTKTCDVAPSPPPSEPLFDMKTSCAIDRNNDGEVTQNEIYHCTKTPQGYICPQDQAQCYPLYVPPICPWYYSFNPSRLNCEYTPTFGTCSQVEVPIEVPPNPDDPLGSNSTIIYETKWKCSLFQNLYYDTYQDCYDSCYASCYSGTFNTSLRICQAGASCTEGVLRPQGCFIGYKCPLDTQDKKYECHDLNGNWACSPHACLNESQLINLDMVPGGYADDGPRDSEGNCLGTVYIFNGQQMRCRKSGVQTGFHNCCNESKGTLYDSTGSSGIGVAISAGRLMYGIFQAIQIGRIAANAATYGVSNIAITVQGGVITRVIIPGADGGILTGQAAQSFVNGLSASGNLEYLTQSGTEIFARVHPGAADLATTATMSDFLRNTGLAGAVVSLATSLLIKDPVLSSAVNLAAQTVLWQMGLVSPIGVAFAVVSLAVALFTKKCDIQDILTATYNESGYCHEVGEFCAKRWPAVGCVQKARGFCCFNSKLARIIHEQGRPQLSTFGPNSWGDPKSPNCRGFLPEEFQALDFNKIDLSEYIEDIQRSINKNIEPQIRDQIQRTWGN